MSARGSGIRALNLRLHAEPAAGLRLGMRMDCMKVDILHIDDCPNWKEAGQRLQIALAATGHRDTTINYRLLTTPDQAAVVEFAGSPTITVDGIDLFPSGGRTSDLACRIYATPSGLAGLPTVEQITEALASPGQPEGAR